MCIASLVNFSEAQTKTYTIAYMTPALHIPFWKDISDGIRQEADKAGVKSLTPIHASAQRLIAKRSGFDYIRVDAIIISPTDSASCPPVLNFMPKKP